jgi:hypothetical protein
LIGFSPPSTGLPSLKSFEVKKPSDMLRYFIDPKIKKADNINVVLARPMQHGAGSFVIAIWLTDNSYKAGLYQSFV